MSAASPIDRARQAYLAVTAAEADVQRERDKLSNMLLIQQQEQQERERLRATLDHDAAMRLLDGEAAESDAP